MAYSFTEKKRIRKDRALRANERFPKIEMVSIFSPMLRVTVLKQNFQNLGIESVKSNEK